MCTYFGLNGELITKDEWFALHKDMVGRTLAQHPVAKGLLRTLHYGLMCPRIPDAALYCTTLVTGSELRELQGYGFHLRELKDARHQALVGHARHLRAMRINGH